MTQRKDFEAWAATHGANLDPSPFDGYKSLWTQGAWRAWQAAQVAQPAQIPAWLPIESAPKDGTVIALANSKITHSGRWSNSLYSGKWWMVGDFVAAFSMIDPPTHWQHLPAAPVAAPSTKENV